MSAGQPVSRFASVKEGWREEGREAGGVEASLRRSEWKDNNSRDKCE